MSPGLASGREAASHAAAPLPSGWLCATWCPAPAVDGIYLLSRQGDPADQAGKPFFKLRLSDRTGTVDCTVWEVDAVGAGLKAGDLVHVSARVTEYQGKAQLEATGVRAGARRRCAAPRFPALHLPRHRGTQGLPAVPHRVGVRPRLQRPAARSSSATRPSSRSSPRRRLPRSTTTPISAAWWSTPSPWPRCATSWPSSTAGWTATCCSPPPSFTTSARRGSWPSRPPSTSPMPASSWGTSSRA